MLASWEFWLSPASSVFPASGGCPRRTLHCQDQKPPAESHQPLLATLFNFFTISRNSLMASSASWMLLVSSFEDLNISSVPTALSSAVVAILLIVDTTC